MKLILQTVEMGLLVERGVVLMRTAVFAVVIEMEEADRERTKREWWVTVYIFFHLDYFMKEMLVQSFPRKQRIQ